jgi:hypothetical protein
MSDREPDSRTRGVLVVDGPQEPTAAGHRPKISLSDYSEAGWLITPVEWRARVQAT